MRTLILDASSLQYRAYYASEARPTFDKNGTPNAAVNLLRTMIHKLRREHAPERILAACDSQAPNFRVKLYPEYKAQRLTPPENYAKQRPGFAALFAQESIPTFAVSGYEADDVIGTLTRRIHDSEIVIVSGDKDMAQLVKDDYGIELLNTNTGELLDEYGVFTHFGVWPAEVVDYLSLVGDTSDNVPGAKGIGPKNALDLIKQFRSVERMIDCSSQISSRHVRHRVLECSGSILMSKKLVTIDCNVPLPEDLTSYGKLDPSDRMPRMKGKLALCSERSCGSQSDREARATDCSHQQD